MVQMIRESDIRAACIQVLFSAVYHLKLAVRPCACDLLKLSLKALKKGSEKVLRNPVPTQVSVSRVTIHFSSHISAIYFSRINLYIMIFILNEHSNDNEFDGLCPSTGKVGWC